jgi:hypothetical protein
MVVTDDLAYDRIVTKAVHRSDCGRHLRFRWHGIAAYGIKQELACGGCCRLREREYFE